ncbi:MAG: MFS transporter [Chloroflexia bacterium]
MAIPEPVSPRLQAAEASTVLSPTTRDAASAEEVPARRAPFAALRHRDFRLTWAGNFVSQAGSMMSMMAMSVQIWDLTHDPAAVGLRGVFKLLPVLFLSLYGGVIADALDRRRLLMLTQTIMAFAVFVLAFATQIGWASVWLIYGLTALSGVAVAFDNPARSALIPNLVPRRDLPKALSLNIIMWQIATIVGPMLGGLFLPLRSTGFALIYWIDAISFTAVLIALFFLRTRPQKAETRDVSLKAAFEGLRFLRKTPIIMSTMTLDFFATLLGAATVLLPAIAEQVLQLDRQLWGILYAAPAIGAVVAGIAMSWLGNVRRQGRIVIISVAAYGLATIVFGISEYFWLTVLALAGTGAADTVSMVMRQTIRQLSTPDELRGRMTSVNMVFYMGGPQLGELEAGLLAKVVGLGPSIMIGGVAVMAVTALVGFLSPALRNYDRDTS